MKNAKEDIQARMLKEQQVEASRVIESIQSALEQDSALLSADEISDIKEKIKDVATIAQSDKTDDIEAAIEILSKSTDTFAERRIDASIRTALAGHTVDEV